LEWYGRVRIEIILSQSPMQGWVVVLCSLSKSILLVRGDQCVGDWHTSRAKNDNSVWEIDIVFAVFMSLRENSFFLLLFGEEDHFRQNGCDRRTTKQMDKRCKRMAVSLVCLRRHFRLTVILHRKTLLSNAFSSDQLN